jgi:hypothetical protein
MNRAPVASTGAKQSSRGMGLPDTRTVSRPAAPFMSLFVCGRQPQTLVDSLHRARGNAGVFTEHGAGIET